MKWKMSFNGVNLNQIIISRKIQLISNNSCLNKKTYHQHKYKVFRKNNRWLICWGIVIFKNKIPHY